MPRLPPAPDLDWSDQGSPRARGFDDVYFSREGGLAEAEAVFLAGCGLPEAWRGKDRFAICELGFGTGLNVLATWRAWKKTRLPHAVLHISTLEAFPLAKTDATRALAQFPEIAELSAQLLVCWPVRAYAPQRLWFPGDGFALTVFTGEAETILASMHGQVDAWYLDGFAPARNPAMWSDTLYGHMARLSAPGARAASFTVAGDVRRGLEGAGFAVEKSPGFGRKRERLEAVLKPTLSLAERIAAQQRGEGRSDKQAPDRLTAPHPLTPSQQGRRGTLYPYGPVAPPKRVAILGAGIAGAACAEALTRRGVETIVLEADRALGAGASGNPAGLVMPRLDRGGGAASELFLAAYLSAVAAYERLAVFDACGVEQRALKDDAALADLLADPPLPSDWMHKLPNGAAMHARGGVVRPIEAIKKMLRGVQILLEAPLRALERADDGWILRAPDGRAMLKSEAVVIACGAALCDFEPAAFLPVALKRGQIEWGEGAAPSHVITQGNYVAPFDGGVLFGATFDASDDVAASAESRAENVEALTRLAPEIATSLNHETLCSRASLRATTPDRMPIAGLLPDAEAWLAQYAALAQGEPVETDAPPPAHAGVYVIGGLGARGLTLAPLLGERIASEICNEPMPLSQFVLDAIHPARFLHRAIKRRA